MPCWMKSFLLSAAYLLVIRRALVVDSQLAVDDESKFAADILAAVNKVRQLYGAAAVDPADDDELKRKATALAEQRSFEGVRKALEDNASDYADFSVNFAVVTQNCAAKMKPEQLVSTFPVSVETSHEPCPASDEQFAGYDKFWTPPGRAVYSGADITKLEVQLYSNGFWPFLVQKKNQKLAVGVAETDGNDVVVVLLFSGWKKVVLPKNTRIPRTTFKLGDVAQRAITACEKMAPRVAVLRLKTEPHLSYGVSTKLYGAFDGNCRVVIKLVECKEESAYGEFMQKCQLYSIANRKFVLCVMESLIFGFGKKTQFVNLGNLFLKTAFGMDTSDKCDKTFIPRAIRYGALRFEPY